MIGIMPTRPNIQRRMLLGALLVGGVSLLHLAPVELGVFGSLIPFALLWPIWGWSGLGPNVSSASLIFILGLWFDAITGAKLGTWAFIGLVTHALVLLLGRYLGLGSLKTMEGMALTALIFAILVFGFDGLAYGYVEFIGMILPTLMAVVSYWLVRNLFDLEEDDA